MAQRQVPGIQHHVDVFDTPRFRDAALISPPAKFRIGAAQIYQALDAVAREKWTKQTRIGLRGTGGLTRDDPVEIVQNIAWAAHGACVPARAIIRNHVGRGRP